MRMWKNKVIVITVTCMLSLLLCFSQVYAQSDGGKVAQQSDFEHKILWVPPKNIANFIKNTKGQKRVVVIYATWCSACIKKIPFLMSVEQKSPGSIIAISVDEDYKMYKRFYNQYEKVPFHLIVNKGSSWQLAKALRAFGGKPWNSIPQVMLLDEANQVLSQGSYSNEDITRFLFGKKP